MIFRKSAYVVALMGALAGSVASEQVEDDIALLKLDDKVYWNRFLQRDASMPSAMPSSSPTGDDDDDDDGKLYSFINMCDNIVMTILEFLAFLKVICR